MRTTIVELDRRAVLASVETVAKMSTEQLTQPTPCTEWNLGELLAHMAAQHRGFAAAARGNGGDHEVWLTRPLGADPVAEYRAAADDVLAAFGADDVLEREFLLPELLPQPFPAATAISFHVVDYVVHTWDVARALGLDIAFDDELLDVIDAVVAAVPNGPEREQAGAAFRPPVAVADDADRLDKILAMLGRSPQWPGPADIA